jgi:hypothetical protein
LITGGKTVGNAKTKEKNPERVQGLCKIILNPFQGFALQHHAFPELHSGSSIFIRLRRMFCINSEDRGFHVAAEVKK